MLDIARRFDLPVDVVATTIIRSVLSECYDFRCDHPEDKVEIKRTPPHCKWCWTFMEILQKPNVFEDAMGREQKVGSLKVKPKRNKFEEELRRKIRREPVSVEQKGGNTIGPITYLYQLVNGGWSIYSMTKELIRHKTPGFYWIVNIQGK